MRSILLKIAVAAMLAAGSARAEAQASQNAGPQIQVALEYVATPNAQKEDQTAVNAAVVALNSQGYLGLASHLDALRTVMKHRPATYPDMERGANGWTIRAASQDDIIALAAHIGSLEQKRGQTAVRVAAEYDIYPIAARLLGSEAIERQAHEEAIEWLDAGLAVQPYDSLLLSEKAVALQGLERWSQTLTMLDAALAADHPIMRGRPAVLLRRRGFALIELGRLAEARRDYEESLQRDPTSAVARRELAYIDGLERGKAPSGSVILTCGPGGDPTCTDAPSPENTPATP